MNYHTPLTDPIDRRDFQEKIRKSIIKRYNVNLVVPQEEESSGSIVVEPLGTMVREIKLPPEEQEELEEPIDEQEQKKNQADEEALRKAEEIVARLMEEAQEDNIAKGAEWAEKLLQERPDEEKQKLYNSATGAYSGIYGQGYVDEHARIKADEIIHEREKLMENMFEANRGVMEE
ncbi:MAG: hypothetical protein RR364_03805 [Lachnospiraceae bacterium]